MPDTQTMSGTVVVFDPAERERRNALDFQDLMKPENRPDEAKRVGGFYIGADGQPHDGQGKPIDDARSATNKSVDEMDADAAMKRLDELESEKAALLDRVRQAEVEQRQRAREQEAALAIGKGAASGEAPPKASEAPNSGASQPQRSLRRER